MMFIAQSTAKDVQRKVSEMKKERTLCLLEAIQTMPPEKLDRLAREMRDAMKSSRHPGLSLAKWAASRTDALSRIDAARSAAKKVGNKDSE